MKLTYTYEETICAKTLENFLDMIIIDDTHVTNDSDLQDSGHI